MSYTSLIMSRFPSKGEIYSLFKLVHWAAPLVKPLYDEHWWSDRKEQMYSWEESSTLTWPLLTAGIHHAVNITEESVSGIYWSLIKWTSCRLVLFQQICRRGWKKWPYMRSSLKILGFLGQFFPNYNVWLCEVILVKLHFWIDWILL